MPTFDCHIVTSNAQTHFSFEIGREGIFLFINPIQFAMLWPWIKP
ncbi:MAG: hypothetical protein V4772_12055 [Pseudomonadota bacterium]